MTDKEWFAELLGKATAHPEAIEDITGSFQFEFSDTGNVWHIQFPDGKPDIAEGALEKADLLIKSKWEVFDKLINKELETHTAMMTGKLKIKGNMKIGMKLEKLFNL